MLIPTFSPQGDGNVYLLVEEVERNANELIPTFSPQGDGNYDNTFPFQLISVSLWLIPTFSPQGDGNSGKLGAYLPPQQRVDPYLFPARGRKLGDWTKWLQEFSYVC